MILEPTDVCLRNINLPRLHDTPVPGRQWTLMSIQRVFVAVITLAGRRPLSVRCRVLRILIARANVHGNNLRLVAALGVDQVAERHARWLFLLVVSSSVVGATGAAGLVVARERSSFLEEGDK